MEPLSILCVVIGLLVIVGRAPMLFAPRASLRFFEDFFSTDARVRGIGIGLAPLAAALIAVPLGDGAVAQILRVLGWLWAGAVVWLLVIPSQYRSLLRGVIDFLAHSVDEAIVRTLGAIGVGIGIALIYYGLYLV